MYVYLSYPLAEGQIAWPDAPVYSAGRHDIIGIDGSACNTSIMVIPNHYGMVILLLRNQEEYFYYKIILLYFGPK